MKRQRRTLRRFKDSNDMVSEVIGTVLLLGITVALFSTLYVTVISHPAPPNPTFVNLVGTVEGSNIILEHRGGDALSLDTEISITIGDKIEPPIKIGDKNYLDEDAKSDNQWNVGERLVYPFEYNLSHDQAEILSVDGKSNSIIMTGSIDITPECNIGLKQTADTRFPQVGSTVTVTTEAIMYWGDIDATSVTINSTLPDGLTYENHFATQGDYDPYTGIWEIDNLVSGESVMLDISAIVTSTGISEFTQLAILLDGSSTISSDEWDIMKTGLADAIEKPIYFPHDGSVELTVIQFGGGSVGNPPRAEIEIGPIVVDDNYMDISNDIRSLEKIGGMTPTACAIYLAADTLSSSPNFDVNIRQVINLVTDGKPNCIWSGIPGDYTGTPASSDLSKESTESAREYLLNILEMTDDKDEFDAEAIGTAPDVDWLRDSIVWPGSYEWESGSPSPPGPGWVRAVSDYEEFADGVHELFDILFGDIVHSAEMISSTPVDIYPENNKASDTITPILP